MKARSFLAGCLGFSMIEALTWIAITSGAVIVSVSGVPHQKLEQDRLIAEKDARKMRLAVHLSADYWYFAEELEESILNAADRWPANLAVLTSGTTNTVAFGTQIGAYNLATLHAGGAISFSIHNDYPNDQYIFNTPSAAKDQSYLQMKAVYPRNDSATCAHANYVRLSLHEMGALRSETTNTTPVQTWGSTVNVTCGPVNTVVTMMVMDPNMIVHPFFDRFNGVASRHNWVASGQINLSGYPLVGTNNQEPSLGSAIAVTNGINLTEKVNLLLASNQVSAIYVNELVLSYTNLVYDNFAKQTNFNTFAEVNFCNNSTRHSDLPVENSLLTHFCNSTDYNLNATFEISTNKARSVSARPLVFGLNQLIINCPDNVVANGEQVANTGGYHQYRNHVSGNNSNSESCVGSAVTGNSNTYNTNVDAASYNGNWGIIDNTSGVVNGLAENFNGYTGTHIYIDTVETNRLEFAKSVSMLENSWTGNASWSVYVSASNAWAAPANSSANSWQATPFSLNNIDSAHASNNAHTHSSLATDARYQRFNAIFAGPYFYNDAAQITARACSFTKNNSLAWQHSPNLNAAQALAQLQSANVYHYRYVASGSSHVGWLAEEAEQAMPDASAYINHGSGDLGFVEQGAGAEIAWKALHEVRDQAEELEAKVRGQAEELRQLQRELAELERSTP